MTSADDNTSRRRPSSMSSNRSWSEVVKRISEMDWEELRVRAHQEIAKRSDLVLSVMGARFVENSVRSSPGDYRDFFFEQADVPGILAFLRRRLPDVVDEI